MLLLETLRFVYRVAELANVRLRTPAQVLGMQRARFRRIIAHARATSPFYRKRFQGIDLRRCPPADLPVLTKAEMMEHFDELVTDRRITRASAEQFIARPENLGKYFLDRYVVCHTSGSQGQPAIIIQDRADLELTFALQIARGHARPKRWRTFLGRLVDPARMATVTLRPGFYPSGAAFAYLPPAARRFVKLLRLSLLDLLPENVAKLNAFRPNFLTGYASVLETLAREERAGRLRLHETGCLEQVTNMSEVLSAPARELVGQAFGVHVADHYAMGECMALSVPCTKLAGGHLNADLALLEVVDDRNRPVPPGRPGDKVLLTNLYNRIQPFIRYEIGDVVTMSPRRCPCGSNLPRIESIQGRTKEKLFIQVNDEYRELAPYVFIAPLLDCLDLAEMELIQTERNRFLLRAAPVPGKLLSAEHLKKLLREGLRSEGLGRVIETEVQIVPEIRPDPKNGKRKRFQPLPPPGEEQQNDPTSDNSRKPL